MDSNFLPRRNNTAYNEDVTTMKGTTMNRKHSKPVRFVATLVAVPLAVSMIPQIIREKIQDFKEDVVDEVEQRIEMAVAFTPKKYN